MLQHPFRLRYVFALCGVLAIYGHVSQRDYEDLRRGECASARVPKAYDPETDRCVKSDDNLKDH